MAPGRSFLLPSGLRRLKRSTQLPRPSDHQAEPSLGQPVGCMPQDLRLTGVELLGDGDNPLGGGQVAEPAGIVIGRRVGASCSSGHLSASSLSHGETAPLLHKGSLDELAGRWAAALHARHDQRDAA